MTCTGDGLNEGGAMTDLVAIGLVVFLILAMELMFFAIMWFGEDNL